MDTMERINLLAAERAKLYQSAANGRRRDSSVLARIKQIGQEIDDLWAQRRRERVGKREGIDLVIDRVYVSTYGEGYEDSISPPGISEADDAAEKLEIAA